MAEQLEWTDQNGNDYKFWLHPVGENYKASSGVYIFAKLGSDTWEPIYIGECESFKERLTDNLEQHHRFDCILKEGATHLFSMIVDGGLAKREGIETNLRQSFQTPCNRQ